MKRVCFAVLIFLAVNSFAQSCLHTGLSNKFDYKVTVTSKKDSDGFSRAYKVTIKVYNKADKKLFQKLEYLPEGIYSSTFADCSNDRSFITGKNKNAIVGDQDYGDIVIADLNFDGKEDIAVKYNLPADVGPEYWYFIQGEHGFKKDEYLSKNMPFFPWLIKPEKKLLISIVSPNWGTNIYQFKYNSGVKKWRRISYKFFYHDKGLENALEKLSK